MLMGWSPSVPGFVKLTFDVAVGRSKRQSGGSKNPMNIVDTHGLQIFPQKPIEEHLTPSGKLTVCY
jgi:hypothetical protein